MAEIDTSIKGFAEIGIKITDEQFKDISLLNMVANNEGKYIPVFNVIMILKYLGLLPEDMIIDPNKNITNEELLVGKMIKKGGE